MAKEETTSTKSNRPPDDNFHQQKLTAWKPIITPLKVIALFTIIGVSFIPTGTFLMSSSNDVIFYLNVFFLFSFLTTECH